jgi:hypothetical protein
MLSVKYMPLLLSVIMLKVIILSVVAPKSFIESTFWTYFSEYWLFPHYFQRKLYLFHHKCYHGCIGTGNTKGGSITVLLTSCLTGLETAVW